MGNQQKYEPRILVCVGCGEEFVFTIDAQEYWYDVKGYKDDPSYCKICHTKKKKRDREMTSQGTQIGHGSQPS